MIWFNNLRIAAKLMAVFTLICAVAIVTGVVNYRHLSVIGKTDAMTIHSYNVLDQLARVVDGMVNSETGVRGYLISGNPEFLQPFESGQKVYQASVSELGNLTSTNPRQQARLDKVKEEANKWLNTVAQEIALMKDPASQSEAREIEASAAGKIHMDALRAKIQEIGDESRSRLSARSAEGQAAFDNSNMTIIASGITIVVLAMLGGLAMVLVVARPVQRLTGAMLLLAEGNFSVVLPGLGRGDEVGDMAQAVENFKVKAAEKVRQETEAKAEQDGIAAAQRKEDMIKLANDFEGAVGQIIETVSSASTELEASAGTLTSTAGRSKELTTMVATASEEASTNVQSVASATEEMASSVNEISRQVQEAARIANEAVDQARKTNDRVGELSKAAGRIGDVVELINTIAGQTNLLALNATIEAARAGEAGRGFAVVASEVKALAEQTARATGEISQQVNGIQAATGESVVAIKEIGSTIAKMSEIASTIASAVEEQGAATQEISRNVQQAAQGTRQVSSNITDVQHGASETGSASSQVLSAAQSLSSESNRLKVEVSKFLNSVRSA
jgi:methyl-accepting chemotaxis protein